ncbi:MAG: Sugar transporter substrate-binding protein [Verrucomicrobia bacterium]|nr:Sugar transporter substrate-binding protein [Verrucomicrobiota bacterium]
MAPGLTSQSSRANAFAALASRATFRLCFFHPNPMRSLLRFSLLVFAFSFVIARTWAAGPSYTIAVIPMGNTHEYWKLIHAGALKAQAELKAQGVQVEVIWKGPLREDDRDQQVQVVENFIGRRVNGIVLAPLDQRALAAPVEQATRAGIPVVVVDSGLKSTAAVSTIATDNRAGGRLAARRLGEVMQGRGNVILLRVVVGSASCEAREAGFLEEIQASYPAIKIISSNQHGGATRETAMAASQNLLNRFGGQVNGIFTPNESTMAGMLLALNNAGLGGGKVKLVGFANSEKFADALTRNDLQGLVLQDPVKMGYLGVKSVVEVLQGKKVPAEIDTGVRLATKENLGDPAILALMRAPAE